MTRLASSFILFLTLASFGACRAKDPEAHASSSPQPPRSEPREPQQTDAAPPPQARPAAISGEAIVPAEPPALPAWWFDDSVWIEGRLSICLQATAESQREAGDDVSRQLLAAIRESFGERPVDVAVTQDLTLLPDGRVRVAALFDITPTPPTPPTTTPPEAPDGDS